jgi:hypothetical protein
MVTGLGIIVGRIESDGAMVGTGTGFKDGLFVKDTVGRIVCVCSCLDGAIVGDVGRIVSPSLEGTTVGDVVTDCFVGITVGRVVSPSLDGATVGEGTGVVGVILRSIQFQNFSPPSQLIPPGQLFPVT